MFARAASLVCVLVLAAVLVPSHADASTVVRITMAGGAGSFDIELNDNTPLERDNFLHYVQAGLYTNTIFHRSDKQNNVLQCGGFTLPANPATSFLDTIPTYAPVAYEGNLGWSNTIGTIGAARERGNPNSATSQWYINMADNSSGFDDAISPGNGFTVFGRIISGWDVAVALFADKAWDWSGVLGQTRIDSPFTTLPLEPSYTGGRWPLQSEFLTIQGAEVLPAAPLPEPATMAMLALGVGGLLRRRFRK
ncbi:MAG: peptidylprolyl isomerase [Planctomycetota bacterium]|nr:peptidylprolyl isomerase [Planctomycetota bacterium]